MGIRGRGFGIGGLGLGNCCRVEPPLFLVRACIYLVRNQFQAEVIEYGEIIPHICNESRNPSYRIQSRNPLSCTLLTHLQCTGSNHRDQRA